jgi:hypothetical protein
MTPLISDAIPGGERSASGGIGSVCEPSGRSSVTQWYRRASLGTIFRHRFALASQPWDSTIG